MEVVLPKVRFIYGPPGQVNFRSAHGFEKKQELLAERQDKRQALNHLIP